MNTEQDRFSGIDGIINSFDEVRSLMGRVHPSIEAKVIDHLDDICVAFIRQSPFVVVATDGDSQIEVSPKGDPAGFVRVLDERRLAIPERPGNRRADSFRNLLQNPRVGLFFMIPGKGETLRVSGEARIVRDEKIRRSLAIDDRVPEFAVVVFVERALMHCPKCVMRSDIWNPEQWPDHAALANVAEAYVQHSKLSMSPDEFMDLAVEEGWTNLY